MSLVALYSNAEILKKTTGNGNQHVPVCLESCYVQSQRKTGQDSLQVAKLICYDVIMVLLKRTRRLSSIPNINQLVFING